MIFYFFIFLIAHKKTSTPEGVSTTLHTDYRVFNVKYVIVLVRASVYTWAHTHTDSELAQHFLLGKTHILFLCS